MGLVKCLNPILTSIPLLLVRQYSSSPLIIILRCFATDIRKSPQKKTIDFSCQLPFSSLPANAQVNHIESGEPFFIKKQSEECMDIVFYRKQKVDKLPTNKCQVSKPWFTNKSLEISFPGFPYLIL